MSVKYEKSKIAYKIIKGLVIGVSIPIVLSSPYGAQGLLKFFGYYLRKSDFNREAKRLKKKGFIALTKTDGGWLVKLLPKAQTYLKQEEFENLKLSKSKVWDGKWRLFSFDIPEENKVARNSLRAKLTSLGCHNIQRSLFAYPHDCKSELKFVAEHYQVEKYTLYAEVSFIDVNKQLRKFFRV